MEAREYHDAYSESLEADFRELESALLSDTVKILAPSEPDQVLGRHHGPRGHPADGREAPGRGGRRDPSRASWKGSSPSGTSCAASRCPGATRRRRPLGDVMTREPESLGPDTLIAYAINRLHNASYRTIPLDRRPGAADRHHDRERHRPVAGGALPRGDPERAARRRAQAPARGRRRLTRPPVGPRKHRRPRQRAGGGVVTGPRGVAPGETVGGRATSPARRATSPPWPAPRTARACRPHASLGVLDQHLGLLDHPGVASLLPVVAHPGLGLGGRDGLVGALDQGWGS